MADHLLTGEGARRRSRTRSSGIRLLRPISGQVVDFSPLGLGIRSSNPLSVGQSYSFLLRRGMKVKRVIGHVAWCRLTKTDSTTSSTTPLAYRSGLEIEHLEPSAWRFLSSETRTTGRARSWR